ncbi:tyrosine-type recombinase/integrase [Humibacter ginsenosidimutans]|uniref:Tyrosine-type recombinase/integrase n=1 Tax=Humibacter ginsenosidimutans TaxID=2599293 RepID=A0A5B8M487_9MICO|nr:tyrosine-type recombinase/integrase [Humibacter ginsenosidimutans]QDZ14754.1 tyrosine-type recombinase/integrase [Humibacter ginsenosidimutans]
MITALFEHAGVAPLELTPLHIIAFVAREGLSQASRASYHASIRAWCKWLMWNDYRADDPSVKTPRPKRPAGAPRPILDEQLVRLLRAANRRRTRMMILLAALAGLRIHEVAKIHGRDLDHSSGVLTVTGKGGKTAMIPLSDELLRECESWPTDDWWFPSYGSATLPHVTPGAVGAAISSAMQRAGIVGTPHQLRHWYGTALLKRGADLRLVQGLMRHESPATTARYTKVDMEQLRSGIARLSLPAA